jgi:hypothetical protein
MKPAQRQVSVRIAGIAFVLCSDDPALALGADGPTAAFLVEAAAPDVLLHATWGEPWTAAGGTKIFDAGSHWQLYEQDQRYCFQFTSPTSGPFPYRAACFDGDFTSGTILLDRRAFDAGLPVYPLDYPLDELLMVNLLANGRGIEIHAFGMLDSRGNGHLFLGHSGAGKTTLARLLAETEGLTILSDDRIILRGTPSGPWIYGTPWHGEAQLASPAGGPLAGVYFLQHGPRNALLPLTRGAAAAALFACAFPPLYRREALDFTLGFCGEVALAVPCRIFEFLPDRRVGDFLLRDAR